MKDFLTDPEIDMRVRQQTVVTALAGAACLEENLKVLLDDCVRRTAEVFDAEYIRIIEFSPGQNSCYWHAGIGWRRGLVGSETAENGARSQIEYALLAATEGPLIFDDLAGEKRFTASKELLEHNIVSGISMVIGDPKRAFGELGVYSSRKSRFGFSDLLFITAVAGIIAAAVEKNLAAEKQKLFFDIAEEIRRANSAETLIEQASQIFRRYLGSSRCIIGEVDEENGRLIIRKKNGAARALSDLEIIRFSDWDERAVAQLKSGRPVIETDSTADKRTRPVYDAPQPSGEKQTQMLIPLHPNGKWAAVLIAGCQKPGFRSRRQIEMIKSAAERVWVTAEELRAETGLSRAENTVGLFLESVGNCAVITIDKESRIQSWNEGAKQMFGFSAGEITGKSAETFFTPEDREKGVLFQEIEKAKKQGSARIEGWRVRKDGSLFFLGGMLLRLDGAKSGFIKIGYDLTNERKREEESRRAREELKKRVRERTRELARTNKILRSENKQRRQVEEERSQLIKQLVTALEDERRRIARDLHDYLGQQLTALRLNLKSLKSARKDKSVLKSKLIETEQIARQIDSDISFLAWRLRPAALDDLGLCDALVHYVEEWSRRSGIKTKIHIGKLENQNLSPETETNLYRIAQEALNNIVKHSKAGRVSVLLEKNGNELFLIVEDDGIGFDMHRIENRKESFGLIGIRERAAVIGGTVEIESAPEKGTTIFVCVPKVSKAVKSKSEK